MVEAQVEGDTVSRDIKDSKEIPLVSAIVALGDGHQIKVDGRGIIVASTNKELLGKRYCESLPEKFFKPDDEVYPLRFRDIDGKIKIYPLRRDILIDFSSKDHKERNKKWD